MTKENLVVLYSASSLSVVGKMALSLTVDGNGRYYALKDIDFVYVLVRKSSLVM